jgi:hypothetical protein
MTTIEASSKKVDAALKAFGLRVKHFEMAMMR